MVSLDLEKVRSLVFLKAVKKMMEKAILALKSSLTKKNSWRAWLKLKAITLSVLMLKDNFTISSQWCLWRNGSITLINCWVLSMLAVTKKHKNSLYQVFAHFSHNMRFGLFRENLIMVKKMKAQSHKSTRITFNLQRCSICL